MYLRILKRDLKRKKTMNVILLVFIILAATDKGEVDRFESFARENEYAYRCLELIQLDPATIKIEDRKFEYSNTCCISDLKNSTKVFDSKDKEITKINDGELYVTAELFYSDKYGLEEGDKILITNCGRTKEFTLKGSTKDAMFGSPVMGMTRMLVSENDFEFLHDEKSAFIYSVLVYAKAADYIDKYNALELNTIFSNNKATIKVTYIMDMLVAAVMLIVSICLILISMVILRFTIHFTMSEEFREIGVMKAIGITNRKIRGLYIVKYFAISVVGATTGFVCSIPFGQMMMLGVSRNKKTLVLSISHDIKTPLSAIKLSAKALSKGIYKDSKKQIEIAENIDARADEIEGVVSEIIKASSEDFLNLEVNLTEFYLSEVIRKISGYYTEKLALVKTEFMVCQYSDCLLRGIWTGRLRFCRT